MTNGFEFNINEAIVQKFSKLTGDKNPLHVDAEFARRTAYRRLVVHGMLIFSYISLHKDLFKAEFTGVPIKASAQFKEPVFYDQKLRLEIDSISDEEPQISFVEFTVCRVKDKAKVIDGKITLKYVDRIKIDSHGEVPSSPNCMICREKSLKDKKLEDIEVGDSEKFDFMILKESTQFYENMLKSGLTPNLNTVTHSDNINENIYMPNLLSLMLLSTSVGMYNPGKYATFLSFNVEIPKLIVLEQKYRFSGIVINKSVSTSIIKKEIKAGIEISEASSETMNGNVHAIVNVPPKKMPDMIELSQSAKGFGLEGKVVLITGASRGIGETIAKLMAVNGANVAINYYRGKNDALNIAEEIMQNGGKALAVGADIRSNSQVKEMVDKVRKTFGDVDILVNNAVRDFKSISFEKLSWNDVISDIDVIVQGAFNCCKAVVPGMVARKSGKIINMGTVATENPPAYQTKYVIAKSALVGLTRALSIEYAAKNVQINMVVPNFVETDLVAHIPLPYRQKLEREMPMKRAASSIDIAQCVIFLASSCADYITGQKIMVTGGGAPYA